MSRSPPSDPADHAEDFAHRWVDRLKNHVEGRMHELGIPEEEIGSSDHARGVAWRTFFPDERQGGGVVAGRRISVDSGVLNLDQLTKAYGEDAGRLWAKSRLRDRIDAIIIHEEFEGRTETHEEVLSLAVQTDCPISDSTRRILHAKEMGWKR